MGQRDEHRVIRTEFKFLASFTRGVTLLGALLLLVALPAPIPDARAATTTLTLDRVLYTASQKWPSCHVTPYGGKP